jgi:hypothetical protein
MEIEIYEPSELGDFTLRLLLGAAKLPSAFADLAWQVLTEARREQHRNWDTDPGTATDYQRVRIHRLMALYLLNGHAKRLHMKFADREPWSVDDNRMQQFLLESFNTFEAAFDRFADRFPNAEILSRLGVLFGNEFCLLPEDAERIADEVRKQVEEIQSSPVGELEAQLAEIESRRNLNATNTK